MTHLTRDVLIKSIVAEEMRSSDGNDYIQSLKDAYKNGDISQVMISVENLTQLNIPQSL